MPGWRRVMEEPSPDVTVTSTRVGVQACSSWREIAAMLACRVEAFEAGIEIGDEIGNLVKPDVQP
jgi:hypothetical protein